MRYDVIYMIVYLLYMNFDLGYNMYTQYNPDDCFYFKNLKQFISREDSENLFI